MIIKLSSNQQMIDSLGKVVSGKISLAYASLLS